MFVPLVQTWQQSVRIAPADFIASIISVGLGVSAREHGIATGLCCPIEQENKNNLLLYKTTLRCLSSP
jgi:hypothetical protein